MLLFTLFALGVTCWLAHTRLEQDKHLNEPECLHVYLRRHLNETFFTYDVSPANRKKKMNVSKKAILKNSPELLLLRREHPRDDAAASKKKEQKSSSSSKYYLRYPSSALRVMVQ
jgi:hypothetical protein